MDKRLSFDENAEQYDRFRPCYCKELFDDIILYSGISKGSSALEVGVGTGQATKPFLDLGCNVEGAEIGSQLAYLTDEKYRTYNNFTIQNCSFENYNGKSDSFDIVYSATAFHWIPENIGYPKAYDLLKEKGTLALFWNRPFVARENDPLHCEIQKIYSHYRPSEHKPIENDRVKYSRIKEHIIGYGFRDVQVKLYHKTRFFNADDYISLLNTYSDHMALDKNTKQSLEDEIKNAIILFGNILTVYDTIDLYLAKK